MPLQETKLVTNVTMPCLGLALFAKCLARKKPNRGWLLCGSNSFPASLAPPQTPPPQPGAAACGPEARGPLTLPTSGVDWPKVNPCLVQIQKCKSGNSGSEPLFLEKSQLGRASWRGPEDHGWEAPVDSWRVCGHITGF